MPGIIYSNEVPEPCPDCGNGIWYKTIQGPGVTRLSVPLECGPGGSAQGRPDVAADPAPGSADGRFLVPGDEAAYPELRWEQHWCKASSEEGARQRDGWRRALSAQARAARSQRGARPQGASGPGMLRRSRP